MQSLRWVRGKEGGCEAYETDGVPVGHVYPVLLRNPQVLDDNVESTEDGKTNSGVTRRS